MTIQDQFGGLWPWIQLGIEIANRHFERTSTPITKEEAEVTARAEYEANKSDIAAWFVSKGLTPPD